MRLPAEVDLAAEHQVARDTVRRALRELESLGAVTRKRGLGTWLQPLEVRPTDASEMHVGLIPPWWADNHEDWKVGDVLEGVTRWADDHNCRVSVIHADAAPRDIEGWTTGVRKRRLTGLIWAHPQAMQIPLLEHTAQWLPTVVIGQSVGQQPIHHVMPDYHQAARLIDEHLVALGHRRYAMVQVDHLSAHAACWIQAIETAQALRGQTLNKRHDLIDFKGLARDRIAEILLNFCPALGRQIQALVLPNSSYLQSFIAHAPFRRRMEKDLSVVAFDFGQYPMAAYWPGRPITHATCPWQEIGRQAMATLALRAENKPAPMTLRIPVQLVAGETTFPFSPDFERCDATSPEKGPHHVI